jgi:hypothetical protein
MAWFLLRSFWRNKRNTQRKSAPRESARDFQLRNWQPTRTFHRKTDIVQSYADGVQSSSTTLKLNNALTDGAPGIGAPEQFKLKRTHKNKRRGEG